MERIRLDGVDGIGKSAGPDAAEGHGRLEEADMARLERAAEARYGAALIRESQESQDKARAEMGQRPAADTERERLNEGRQHGDQVELSNQLRSRMDGVDWAGELKALLEMLKRWSPDAEKGGVDAAAEELEKLAELYQKLVKLLSSCPDAQAYPWMEQVESALWKALRQFEAHYLREEVSFFSRFGPPGMAGMVHSSLYGQVAGRMPSQRGMVSSWAGDGSRGVLTSQEQFAYKFGERMGASAKPFGTDAAGAYRPSMLSRTEAGRGARQDEPCRKPVGPGGQELGAAGQKPAAPSAPLRGYRPEQLLHQEKEAFYMPAHKSNVTEGASASLAFGGTRPFGKADLLRTEQFCRFINGEEVAGQWRGLEGLEETAGCVAAMVLLMGRVYAVRSGVGPQMGHAVRAAVERMVDYYMGCLFEKGKAAGTDRQKRAMRVYRHVLDRIQSGESIEDSMEDGVRLAAGYLKDRVSGIGPDDGEGIAGKQLRHRLRQCWERYRRAVGMDGTDLELLSQSPWGIGLEVRAGFGSLARRSLALLGVALAVVMLCLYMRG